MKKRKKNNKPLIILVVGLLVFGSLLGVGFYKLSEHKKFLVEDKKEFEKKLLKKKYLVMKKLRKLKKILKSMNLILRKLIERLLYYKDKKLMNS